MAGFNPYDPVFIPCSKCQVTFDSQQLCSLCQTCNACAGDKGLIKGSEYGFILNLICWDCLNRFVDNMENNPIQK